MIVNCPNILSQSGLNIKDIIIFQSPKIDKAWPTAQDTFLGSTDLGAGRELGPQYHQYLTVWPWKGQGATWRCRLPLCEMGLEMPSGAPIVAQWKCIWPVSIRTKVWSLASLSGLRIRHCHELCGIGHRCGLDPALLWLCCRLAPAAPSGPLAWELPYAAYVALKKKKNALCCGCAVGWLLQLQVDP